VTDRNLLGSWSGAFQPHFFYNVKEFANRPRRTGAACRTTAERSICANTYVEPALRDLPPVLTALGASIRR
jgi:hypothetical protein